MKNEKNIVSIIVPVFNEQDKVGYCLNSLVSQTWTGIEIIVVDDGSTDDSLEICKNYERLYPSDDNRFPRIRAIHQDNGGVSAARNRGLKEANGDYLLFLDGDDMLAPEAVEKLVSTALLYDTDLTCGGLEQVVLPDFSDRGMKMKIGNLSSQEVVMDGKYFRENIMRLIAHTFMMEGLYAKLYRMQTWKNNHLTFPTDLSLGEDFSVNMQFYHLCKRVAMIDEILYFYNSIPKDHSLSRIFRYDRFEIQARLMGELKLFLNYSHGTEREKEEENEYYAYSNSHTVACLYEIGTEKNRRTIEEQKCEIARILNHPMARESAYYTTWWKPGFEGFKLAFDTFDVAKVMDLCLQIQGQENNNDYKLETMEEETVAADEQEEENTIVSEEEAWRASIADRAGKSLINRLVRAGIRFLALFARGNVKEELRRKEELVYWHGVRYAFSVNTEGR